MLAFLAGAGMATTAMILVGKARESIAPTADDLLKRCDRAADALDLQVSSTQVA